MPFSFDHVDDSWKILHSHAGVKTDSWVEYGEHEIVKVIVCIANNSSPTTHKHGFACQLALHDVLLLFKHSEPGYVEVAAEISIRGTYHQWSLSKGGMSLGLIRERLPQATHKGKDWWDACKKYVAPPDCKSPFKCHAVYATKAANAVDDVHIQLFWVAQNSIPGIVDKIKKRTKSPKIQPKDNPGQVDVHCLVPV